MSEKIVRVEKRQRGFFGHLFKWVFIGFNLLMAYAMFSGLNGASEVYQSAGSDAGRAGASVGMVLGAGMLLALWVAGDIILGFFVLMTRGKKVIVEERAA
jgi:hypothetical protein